MRALETFLRTCGRSSALGPVRQARCPSQAGACSATPGFASRCVFQSTKKPRNSEACQLERAKGVEPSSSAWEAEVMPLYDARVIKFQAVVRLKFQA